MGLEEDIQRLAETAKRSRGLLNTERATQMTLVEPFLKALGYNVSDPREVIPEFEASYLGIGNERVDYAIFRDGVPSLVVETKRVGESLDPRRHLNQLFSYMVATSASIGILTNGIQYRFYRKPQRVNVKEHPPFLILDITNLSSRGIDILAAFSKDYYSPELEGRLVEEMDYLDKIRERLASAHKSPDDSFVDWIMRETYRGNNPGDKKNGLPDS